MGKVILWIIVVFLLLFAWRAWSAAKRRSRWKAKSPSGATAEPMVRCTRCGVFLPKPEARLLPDGYRCSDPACANRPPAQ